MTDAGGWGQGGTVPDAGTLEGTVVQALSGWFVVETAGGRLLCRPRGRFRARDGDWRDLRDAERAEAAMDAAEEGGALAEGPEGATPAAAGEDSLAVGEVPPPSDRPRRSQAVSGPSGRQRAGRSALTDGPATRGRPSVEAGAEKEVEGVLAGDRVLCRDVGDGEGAIEAVASRRSALARPPVANVDLVAVVVAWREPLFSAAFVDRLLLEAGVQGCAAVLCVNKADRLEPADRDLVADAVAPYARAGYPVCLVSAVTGEGVPALRAELTGHLTVAAGPSGAGKSRLLGALVPERPPRSGEVSRRAGRGRHTTRHVELLALPGGGWVADTPGFSRLEVDEMEPEELAGYYPEFAACGERCRFRGCLHDREPDCGVRAAVAAGVIDAGRHERYLGLLGELRQVRARRY